MLDRECSFCKAPESETNPLIAGDGVYICEHCIVNGYKILFGDQEEVEKAETVPYE